jgi:hypothetical protein
MYHVAFEFWKWKCLRSPEDETFWGTNTVTMCVILTRILLDVDDDDDTL